MVSLLPDVYPGRNRWHARHSRHARSRQSNPDGYGRKSPTPTCRRCTSSCSRAAAERAGRCATAIMASRASIRSAAIPAIDLKAARELGSKALRAAAEGRDPGHEKAQARAAVADSVELVAAQFIERHCKRSNRPRTAVETERLLNLHVLPRWRGRLLREITRRDVLELLDRVVDSGKPIAANRVLSAVRKLFNWAVARDIIAASPCAGVKPPTAERSRDRVLNDDELRNVWQAAEHVGYPFGSLVKLLILTGQRRDECAGMKWSELGFGGADMDAAARAGEEQQAARSPVERCRHCRAGTAPAHWRFRADNQRRCAVERLCQGQAAAGCIVAGHAGVAAARSFAAPSHPAWRGSASTCR